MKTTLVAVVLAFMLLVGHFFKPAVVFAEADAETAVTVMVDGKPVVVQGIITKLIIYGAIAVGSALIGGVIGYQLGRQSVSGVTAEAYVQDMSSVIWSWSKTVHMALKASTTFLNTTYTYISSYASLYGYQYCTNPANAPFLAVKSAGETIGIPVFIKDVINVTALWVGESARLSQYMAWRWSQAGKTGNYWSTDGSVVLRDLNNNVINPGSSLSSIVVKIYADGSWVATVTYVSTGSEVVYAPPTLFNDTAVTYIHERLVAGVVPAITVTVKFGASPETAVRAISYYRGGAFEDMVVSSVVSEILSDIRHVYGLSRDVVSVYVTTMNQLGCPSSPLPLPTQVLLDPQVIAGLTEEEKMRIYVAYLVAMSTFDWRAVGNLTGYFVTIATNQSFMGDIPAYGLFNAEIYFVDFGKSSITIRNGRNVLDTWAIVLAKKDGYYYYLYLLPGTEIINDGSTVTIYRTTLPSLLQLYPAPLQYQPSPTPQQPDVQLYVMVGALFGLIGGALIAGRKRSAVKNTY